MIRIVVFCLLIVGFSGHGQDRTFSEFDLYGRWVLELENDPPEKFVYKLCRESDPILSEVWLDISLLAFNKCIMNSSVIGRGSFCASEPTQSTNHTWVFDQENEIIVISTINMFLKEFSETNPEEYADFGSPKWVEKTEYKIVRLPGNEIGLE